MLKNKRKPLPASVTVEASLTVSLSLLAIFSALGICFRNHDAVLQSAVLNERLELYSHAPADAELAEGEIPDERLGYTLSAGPFRMSVRNGTYSIAGRVEGDEYSDEQELRRFEPQKMMRGLTLVEEIGGKEK
jgi:hypothetical protein